MNTKQFNLSGGKETGSISSNPDTDLPKFVLNDFERIWLQALYETSMSHKRPNLRTIKSQLKDQLPRSYDPATIPPGLTFSNGEEISPLGIRALEESDDVLQKMNAILYGIQEQLDDDPEIKTIELADIARRIVLPNSETSFLFYLMTRYFRFSSSGGTRTQGYYGMEYLSIDDAAYKAIMACEDVIPQIRKALVIIEGQPTVNTSPVPVPETVAHEDEDGHSTAPGTTATQALALHFLLNHCGLNPINNPTPVARFLQFLTGKETKAKKIQNTNLYKNVAHPFKTHEKTVLKELKTIRALFDDMDLQQIVNAIDEEIKTSKQSG